MSKAAPPSGFPLTTLPPLYQFTFPTERGYAWSNSGVYLLDYQGEPHWFATDGISAMLTPALHDDGTDSLWKPRLGAVRIYRQDHIKNLFKYTRKGWVMYETSTGMLYSPDMIMQVPPFTFGQDDDPEPTARPDIETPFEGGNERRSMCEFDLRLVSAIRGAFKHTDRNAAITQSFLEGGRVLFDIELPYKARIILAPDGETLQQEDADDDSDTD